MENKTNLRLWAKSIRKNLNTDAISRKISDKIRSLDVYKNAENIMIFYPLKYEINLLSLMEDNKQFYLPRVKGENLLVCPFAKCDRLEKSEFDVFEPLTAPVSFEILDVVIVPALAVDQNNFRLGYGGGFYDRFLKSCKAYSIVPVPQKLVVEKLSVDDFDVPVDCVITE